MVKEESAFLYMEMEGSVSFSRTCIKRKSEFYQLASDPAFWILKR